MLPQMMPLPWVLVFFSLFVSIFTISLLISGNFLCFLFIEKKALKVKTYSLPW